MGRSAYLKGKREVEESLKVARHPLIGFETCRYRLMMRGLGFKTMRFRWLKVAKFWKSWLLEILANRKRVLRELQKYGIKGYIIDG
jgi:hypothetical protein